MIPYRAAMIVREGEHAPCYNEEQAFHALTDGCEKYISRPLDGSEQLFDLQEDPTEVNDLSTDVDSATNLYEWRTRLAERLADRPEVFSRDGELVAGCDYPALNAGVP